MGEIPPLAHRIADEARRARSRSDANHQVGGRWRTFDAEADAELGVWLTVLGMAVDDASGIISETAASVRKTGAAFLAGARGAEQ